VAVVPLIEIIDDSTFQLTGTPIQNIQVGGFDWNLIFNWHVTPEREMKRRLKKTDPIRSRLLLDPSRTRYTSEIRSFRSPTMAGGLFAIDRDWFDQLGMYDPGMDIWGGENLELSFKVLVIGIDSTRHDVRLGVAMWRRTRLCTVFTCWTYLS
jgi:polypeptide N-acetylgalactosaminyltransferase